MYVYVECWYGYLRVIDKTTIESWTKLFFLMGYRNSNKKPSFMSDKSWVINDTIQRDKLFLINHIIASKCCSNSAHLSSFNLSPGMLHDMQHPILIHSFKHIELHHLSSKFNSQHIQTSFLFPKIRSDDELPAQVYKLSLWTKLTSSAHWAWGN